MDCNKCWLSTCTVRVCTFSDFVTACTKKSLHCSNTVKEPLRVQQYGDCVCLSNPQSSSGMDEIIVKSSQGYVLSRFKVWSPLNCYDINSCEDRHVQWGWEKGLIRAYHFCQIWKVTSDWTSMQSNYQILIAFCQNTLLWTSFQTSEWRLNIGLYRLFSLSNIECLLNDKSWMLNSQFLFTWC